MGCDIEMLHAHKGKERREKKYRFKTPTQNHLYYIILRFEYV